MDDGEQRVSSGEFNTLNVNVDVKIMAGIKKAINTHDMLTLTDDDSVVVGLSGGADSLMLTHYLKFVLNTKVYACHVNHMLRGNESVHDMEFVQDICRQWDVPLIVHSVDVTQYAQQNKLSIEQAGRDVRYTMFENTRQHFGAKKIATAHTLSDNAETILLNLCRGSGLKGLCGIPPIRGLIIRPLIHITRQDVEEYCKLNDIAYVTDSTNLKNIYTRNKIRLEVMPKLAQVNPQVFTSIDRTIAVINNENDYINMVSTEAYENASRQGGLFIPELTDLHIAIRHRVYAMFLDENNIERSNDLIAKIDKLVLCDKGKLNVKSDLYIEIKKHTLLISDNNKMLSYFEYPLELGPFVNDNGQCYNIKLCDRSEIEIMKKIYKKLLYICLDYDKIIGTPIIRNRKTGDKITLKSRGGTKSIKKLFIDDKLTAIEKSQVLVLSDDESVIAVMGYGEDVRVLPDENTTNFLVIV